jgi:DNA polymerase-1
MYKPCTKLNQVEWLISKLHSNDEWSFDTETHGTFLNGYIFIISFSWKSGTGFCIDFRFFNEEESNKIWNLLKDVFQNNSKKITQNGTYDVKFLWKKGITINNWYSDTILEDHLLDENRPHGLEHLANRYTHLGGYHNEFDKYVETHPDCDPKRNGTFLNIPYELIHPYSCIDADVTLQSHKKMMPLIKKEGLEWLLFNIQMPIQKILCEVEYNGVSIDIDYNNKLKDIYNDNMNKLWNEILSFKEVQNIINRNKQVFIEKYNNSKIIKRKYLLSDYLEKNKDKWEFKLSTKQLTELIINEFKMTPIAYGKKKNKKTGTFNISMNSDVLDEYANKLPIAKLIQNYRQLMFLNGTFIEGLRNFIVDGKIHSNYPLYRTVTGRPSSLEPNLNNIPRKMVEIKHQFIADRGDYLVEADYSQIEFRIWAHYCMDKQMISDINNSIDIHKLMAAMGKGLDIPSGDINYEDFLEWTKDITKEERNIAKTVVFGLMYGRGAKAVAKELEISIQRAQKIIDSFFNRYPVAKSWLIKTAKEASNRGYVINLYGRRRRLPILLNFNSQIEQIKNEYKNQIIKLNNGEHIDGPLLTKDMVLEEIQKIEYLRAKAERQAINSPIQSGASDTTFLAAIRINNEIKRLNLKSRMILTVYDSLIYNVKPHELETMLRLIRNEMLRDMGKIRVSLNCEIKVGHVWGKLEEVQFDNENNPKIDCIEIIKST